MAPAKKAIEGRSRLPLLVGLAAVLGGVLLWDQGGNRSPGSAKPTAVAIPEKGGGLATTDVATDAGDEGGESQDSHPLAGLGLGELGDTVRRPLFEKKRRPVEPPPARAAAAPVPRTIVSRPAADPNALTLLGVLMSDGKGGGIALLRRNNSGQNLRLQEGDAVDGWTIERIESDTVLLKQGDTQLALQLFRRR